MRKHLPTSIAGIITAVSLAACGASSEPPAKTVTVVKETTVEVPPSTPPTAPTGETGTTGPEDPAKPALPGGRAAIDGRYAMKTSDGDPVVPYVYGVEWFGEKTDCSGEQCTLTVRRGLNGGGFKNYELESVPGDAKRWVGEAKGQASCDGEDGEISTTERMSLRVSATDTVNGRPTARRFDAYLKVRGTCKDGEPLEGNGVLRASLDDG